MASLSELITAVNSLLSLTAARRRLQLNSHTEERAYEAYIFSLCVKAVRELGGTVDIRGINSGSNPNPLIFRGSPGAIYSTTQNYGYALCEISGKQFEIHVDVQFRGSSTANHEIDVSFIDHVSSERCRVRREFPNMAGHLIGAIECKYYSGDPGVALARTFAGLISDSSSNRINAFVYNKKSRGIQAFYSKLNSASGFFDLTPLEKKAEDRFVAHISNAIDKWSSRR